MKQSSDGAGAAGRSRFAMGSDCGERCATWFAKPSATPACVRARRRTSPPWRRDSNEMASGKPGAVQFEFPGYLDAFTDRCCGRLCAAAGIACVEGGEFDQRRRPAGADCGPGLCSPDRSSVPSCSGQSRPSPSGGREEAASLDRPCARRRRDLAVGTEECSRRGSNQRMAPARKRQRQRVGSCGGHVRPVCWVQNGGCLRNRSSCQGS